MQEVPFIGALCVREHVWAELLPPLGLEPCGAMIVLSGALFSHCLWLTGGGKSCPAVLSWLRRVLATSCCLCVVAMASVSAWQCCADQGFPPQHLPVLGHSCTCPTGLVCGCHCPGVPQ